MRPSILIAVLASVLSTVVQAQLSGSVGPLTDYATKAKNKTCDITDYGAVDDGETDIADAIVAAWDDCSIGGLVYIPPGNYSLATRIELKNGESTAIQLDGVINRGSDDMEYQMILVRGASDFEFFSGNSQGAIQGFGYQYLAEGEYGVRFFRFQDITNFSVHGFASIDSPGYYFVFDSCNNGEIYNLLLRGVTELGMTDGIDIWGQNIWVHDVEVTNGDECVTVKSPSNNLLIESIYCNLSGGTAIGSLSEGTNVTDIHYRNLYMNNADACYLKSHNGDGLVQNILWENVIIHGGPYPLAVNQAWGSDSGGTGIQVSNLTYKDWYGESESNSRPVIRLECDADVPCYDITIDNVNLWSSDGDYVEWSCQNAYGSGACLAEAESTDGLATYTTAQTVTATPSYSATTMPGDYTTPPPSASPFTIPPMPTSFFPGATPISTLLSLDSPGGLWE